MSGDGTGAHAPAVHRVATHAGAIHALRQPALRQSLYDAAAILMSDVLVNLHGEAHRARRTVEARVFRKDVFLRYEKEVLPKTLAETIAPFLAAGAGDLVDIGYRIMLNLTVDFAGIDRVERSHAETSELLRLLKAFSLAPALGQSLPEDVPAKQARIAEAMADFEARFLKPSLARRRALLAEVQAGRLDRAALPADVLMTLVEGADGLGMTEAQFVQEGIFYMLAGAHTTIHSLTHAFHELTGWLAADPARRARLAEPFFLQACVFESVRLHPSSPVARRRALEPVVLAEGGAVAAGEEVIVDLHAANRDPALFGPDPDRFDPVREVAPGVLPYGLSMGHGMHACLGRNLAVGVEPRPGSDPLTHQFGVVPLILAALLEAGMRPDPDDPPALDQRISRVSFIRYPVRFGGAEAGA